MEILASRVLIRPRHFDRSLDFYGRVIGLHVYREFGRDASRGVVFFLGGGYLELSGRAEGAPSRDLSLWLQVPAIEEAHRRLVTAGCAIEEAPTQKPWGLVEMRARDPDGVGLIFVEVPDLHPLRRDLRS